jgi:hypothetical protein
MSAFNQFTAYAYGRNENPVTIQELEQLFPSLKGNIEKADLHYLTPAMSEDGKIKVDLVQINALIRAVPRRRERNEH